MAKQKYYDYLKPKLPRQSFSDMVDQQLEIVQQQQQMRASQDMQIMKARQKQLESQQKQLLGFDVSDMSELDKQTFGSKRDWLKGRIDNYYYGPQNYGEFVEDVNTLKTLHAELKNHSDNVSTSLKNLEGWVTGTKDWTNKELELRDDINTFNAKRQMWEQSGIDPTDITVDANGDTYGFYTDINGVRLKDENGRDLYGLAVQAPSRGSQEYFSPTTAPYANILPGKFSKDFAAAAKRLRNNPDLSMDEKLATLRSWVTTEALGNPSIIATANNTFVDNYGGSAQAAITQDAQNDPGDGSYVPIQLREYIDDTMVYLKGNLEDTSEDKAPPGSNPTPSTQRFNLSQFTEAISGLPTFQVYPQTEGFGLGITNMLVPRSGVGSSTVMVARSYQPQSEDDPRFNEVSDQFKAKAVAMDVNKNLFVQAEMLFEVGEEELPPELAARRANLIAQGFDTEAVKVSRVKKTVPIVITPTISIDGATVRNPEYMTLLAQIAYVKGYKIDDQVEAAAKGMDILDTFNDEQAQIAAALPGN